MGQQIIFLEKNKADFDYTEASVLASENDDISQNAVNRKVFSAWQTDTSNDAANTTFELFFGRTTLINFIIIAKHNFKSFKIEYWDGVSAYVAFAQLVGGAAIDETVNTKETNSFQTVDVDTTKIRLTIRGTFVVDAQKILVHFIGTELLGQLEGFPIIDSVEVGRETNPIRVLGGKSAAVDIEGAYTGKLSVSQYVLQDDLDKITSLFKRAQGFLYWPCGGDESQFTPLVEGYRLEDIYLSRFFGKFKPNYKDGVYPNGLVFSAPIREVVK